MTPDKKRLRKRTRKPVTSPDFIKTYNSSEDDSPVTDTELEDPRPRQRPITLSAEEAMAMAIENAHEG